MATDNTPTLLNINLFPNDGLSKGEQGPPTAYSLVTQPDGKQVQVTAADFLAGWRGRVPPFSNNDLKFREPVTLHKGVVYEGPGWANNDLKAKDAQGNKLLLQRNGRDIPPREGDGPPVGNQVMLRYLNIAIKVSTYKRREEQAPPPVPPAATVSNDDDYSELDL